ncbi:reverse transcriptase family protein [Algicella marina]|uniref:RNA-directed DNA polymerase n=1 Tax=Algicella marina TaxID=2683284 RepID=A0A6P1SZQ9_9RHOB|nr:reverse transcriptase family protein [Algicella marina]QHQ34519.1 RNA-directed DNA polymerase [Algicella marina]
MPKKQSDGGYHLKDSPFFRLRSRKQLAELLRVSANTLDEISHRSDLYVRRWKHKKLKDHERGAWLKQPPPPEKAESYRPIDIPDVQLKAMQKRIGDLLGRVKAPEFLFSPVKGRSYVENAAHHKESKAFWLLDVADYFPSCSANNVAHFFHRVLECSRDVTAVLVHLVTLNECLPQGSPCSPILAYYSNSHVWLAVEELVKARDCKLSLYADDITISGDVVPKALIWDIKKLIFGNGLRLKDSKEVSLINAPADITGVIVKEGGTHLPNRQLKMIAELKQLRARTTNPKLRGRLDEQISGRLSQRKQVENPKT